MTQAAHATSTPHMPTRQWTLDVPPNPYAAALEAAAQAQAQAQAQLQMQAHVQAPVPMTVPMPAPMSDHAAAPMPAAMQVAPAQAVMPAATALPPMPMPAHAQGADVSMQAPPVMNDSADPAPKAGIGSKLKGLFAKRAKPSAGADVSAPPMPTHVPVQFS